MAVAGQMEEPVRKFSLFQLAHMRCRMFVDAQQCSEADSWIGAEKSRTSDSKSIEVAVICAFGNLNAL